MEPIRIELPTALGIGPVNAYLFTEPDVVLVDAGVKTDTCWDALVGALAKHNLTPAGIDRIVITHAHVDHYGLAARLAEESQARVWISELGAPWIESTSGLWQQRLDYYRHVLLPRVGLPPAEAEMILALMHGLDQLAEPVASAAINTFNPDGMLTLGGRSWQVLHAPGHTSMQTCFYQPETRRLISADMLLPIAPPPVIEQPLGGRKERLPALPIFMRSLALFERLDIDTIYPGHGPPFGNHRVVIGRQRRRIQQRQAECLRLIAEGRDMIPELIQSLYANRMPAWQLPGLWMTIGYLDLLREEGLVTEETIDGVWHYAPT